MTLLTVTLNRPMDWLKIVESLEPMPSLDVADSAGVSSLPAGYSDFLLEIKAQIRQRQFQALRSANKELLALYWWLGENISQRQLALGWGKGVVENLARDLQAEFPGRNGFSARNLWNMRDFYREYAEKPKLQPLVAEISWAKNLVILARCKNDLEREFYLRATARFGWTKNVLQHQFDNHSYAQYLNGQTNFDAVVPDSIKAQALLAVKDHYTLDFLGLAEEPSERELEQALVRTMTRPPGLATYTVTPQLPASYWAAEPRADCGALAGLGGKRQILSPP